LPQALSPKDLATSFLATRFFHKVLPLAFLAQGLATSFLATRPLSSPLASPQAFGPIDA